MEYTFTLRRETGAALLAGLAVCFVLVFLAGWMVGLNSQVAHLAADTSAVAPDRKANRGGQGQENEPGPGAKLSESTDSVSDVSDRSDLRVETNKARPGTSESPSSRREEDMEKDSSAAFTIQIGGYADRANAQQVARRVRRAEETVFVRPEQQKGRTLYRVWVGRYETRSAAARRLDAVGDYTGSAFVTRMGEAP